MWYTDIYSTREILRLILCIATQELLHFLSLGLASVSYTEGESSEHLFYQDRPGFRKSFSLWKMLYKTCWPEKAMRTILSTFLQTRAPTSTVGRRYTRALWGPRTFSSSCIWRRTHRFFRCIKRPHWLWSQIFGFQFKIGHENGDWDPTEAISLRHRLPTHAIKVNGLPQIEALHSQLQEELDRMITQQLDAQNSPQSNERPGFSWGTHWQQ